MVDLHVELNPRVTEQALSCPVCGAGMQVSDDGHSLLCTGTVSERNPNGRHHCFDGGSGGYVSLSPNRSGSGDSREAVAARKTFLSGGYYRPVSEALCRLVRDYTPDGGIVLDAGCGEGYYSEAVAEAGFPLLGVDLSKFAVDAAAKSARMRRKTAGQTGNGSSRTVFAVSSVFDLPVRDRAFDTVINVFAPCAPGEYARVLKPDGVLIVAGAGETHLLGLKKLLYDDPYLNTPRADLPSKQDPFTCIARETVSFTIRIGNPSHREALFSMTPYYWRTPKNGVERLQAQEILETEVSVDFAVYRKSASGQSDLP